MKIDEWLNSPWFVRILALFLALMLYTAVNMEMQKSPKPSGILPSISQETEVLTNIPLNVYYDQDKYVLSNLPQTVNVYIEGTNSAIKAMKAQGDYEVFIDLNNLTVGTHTVAIQQRNMDKNLKVRFDPTVIKVTLDEKVEKTMVINIQTLNEDKLPEGYTAEEPIVVPNSVKVKGSKDAVERIGFIEGYIDVGGANDSVEKDVALNVYDLNGKQLNLEIEPAVVEVNVSISPPSKNVPFKINRKGTLPKGISIQSFEVSSTAITIFGPRDKIDMIEMIENIDVDLSTITMDQTIEVKVPVPQGLKKVSPEVLTIKVDVEKEVSKTLTNIPVKINGIADAKDVKLITPEDGAVNLTVFGAEKVLEGIEAADFDVRINVSEIENGEREVDIVAVSGPANIRWEINPSKALVDIQNK